jgi:hypothetical protein
MVSKPPTGSAGIKLALQTRERGGAPTEAKWRKKNKKNEKARASANALRTRGSQGARENTAEMHR